MFDSSVQRLPKQANLPAPEQVALLTRARAGDTEARDKLFASLQGMVFRRAHRFPPGNCDRDDLLQQGFVGILEALEDVDPVRGASASSLAWRRVHWSISALLKKSGTVKCSSKAKAEIRQFQFTAAHDLMKQGIEPTPARVAEALGVSEADYITVSGRAIPLTAFDDSTKHDAEMCVVPAILRQEADQEDFIEIQPLREAIARLRPTLNEKELKILDSRLLSDDPESYGAMGEEWGVSKQYMQQICSRLMDKIKAEMGAA